MSQAMRILSRPRWLRAEAPKQSWALVAAWLLLIFYLLNSLIPRIPSADFSVYVLQPLLWLSLGALALGLRRWETGRIALPSDRGLVIAAFLIGLSQIALFLLAGMLVGFGNSPYARQILRVALNVWFIGAQLIGLELARWYLVTSLGRRNTFLGVGIAWLLFSLVTIPVASYRFVAEPGAAFRFVGRTFLPTVSGNLLTTYLALVGGPWAALAYRGALAAFEWLSPILPNLKWTITAFLGTVIPILGLLAVHDLVESRAPKSETVGAKPSGSSMGWALAAVVIVFIFWFNTGLFGIRPFLVSGVSMEPTLKAGDIAITREVPPSEIKVGDVVQFKLEGSSVLHRVIEIRQEGGQFIFVTEGDNNKVEDSPWDQSRLEGRMIAYIPKVGWIAIALKSLLGKPR